MEATMQKTWFVTGASRGLGLQIAKAAMQAGDRVVAAGRKRTAITGSLGAVSDQLLSVQLDVTVAHQARAAVDDAVSRFGAIDVLVNNAGYGHLGFFEETTMQDAHAQFGTNLFGAFNVTWAALPTMRSARKGQIFNISSIGGIVEPGPFRTDFLTEYSLRFGDNVLPDYNERRARLRASFEHRNGRQPGDPAKLAEAIVRLAGEPEPPMRFVAGSIAVQAADSKLAGMRAELGSWRRVSVGTDGNYAT